MSFFLATCFSWESFQKWFMSLWKRGEGKWYTFAYTKKKIHWNVLYKLWKKYQCGITCCVKPFLIGKSFDKRILEKGEIVRFLALIIKKEKKNEHLIYLNINAIKILHWYFLHNSYKKFPWNFFFNLSKV